MVLLLNVETAVHLEDVQTNFDQGGKRTPKKETWKKINLPVKISGGDKNRHPCSKENPSLSISGQKPAEILLNSSPFSLDTRLVWGQEGKKNQLRPRPQLPLALEARRDGFSLLLGPSSPAGCNLCHFPSHMVGPPGWGPLESCS